MYDNFFEFLRDLIFDILDLVAIGTSTVAAFYSFWYLCDWTCKIIFGVNGGIF